MWRDNGGWGVIQINSWVQSHPAGLDFGVKLGPSHSQVDGVGPWSSTPASASVKPCHKTWRCRMLKRVKDATEDFCQHLQVSISYTPEGTYQELNREQGHKIMWCNLVIHTILTWKLICPKRRCGPIFHKVHFASFVTWLADLQPGLVCSSV